MLDQSALDAGSGAMTETVPPASHAVARGRIDAFDGVRAIAILMVLAFHFKGAGVPYRGGGYLGVDVFFVLSGFLITSLLLAERGRTHHISFRGFYARRALRLVPVAAVLLVIGVVVILVAPASNAWRPQPIALAALPGAWMNWLDVWRPAAGGVLGHTWSLAIEAQFYFVWPPVLGLALARRVRLRFVVALLLAGVAVAVALRFSAWSAAPAAVPRTASDVDRYLTGAARGAAWSRWYFGTFTHMDGLLLGAVTAIVMTRRRVRDALARHARVATGALIVAAVVVIAVVVEAGRVRVDGFVPEWGLLPLEVAVAVILAVLVAAPATVPARILAWGPLVWIGRRSYAMYMLHIPVWMVVVHFTVGGSRDLQATAWLAIAITFGVSELSYRFVEAPAARWRRRLSAAR
jgi:peptidoglycan/LPS O-acetylase OafA/YrhL